MPWPVRLTDLVFAGFRPELGARGARYAGWADRFGWVAAIGTVLPSQVRYARADDGVTIAYPVAGAGPVTRVVVSPLVPSGNEFPAIETGV